MDTSTLKHLPEEDLKEILRLTEAKSKLEVREKASNLFMPFAHHVYENFIEGRHHRIIAEKLERVAKGELKRLIVCMPPRHKLELDTPVATTSGWKTIETIKAGDYVYGSDGRPQLVTGKSEVYEEELYEVTTDEGESFVTDGAHRWAAVRSVRTSKNGQRSTRQENVVVSTKDIADCKLRKDRATKLVPRPCLDFPEADLPVDPYVLGVWLGDGHSNQAIITSPDGDRHILRREFERRGYVTTNQKTPSTFGVLALRATLRDELNVLGNKHIPDIYLRGSFDQRMDLLRGLMDTDGTISAKGQCFFAQSDKPMIQSVRKLLWSLGIKNTVQSYQPVLEGSICKRAYNVSFYHDDVSNIPRKQGRCKAPTGFGSAIYANAKRLNCRGLVQCISVENADQVFLVGRSMTPTMNSKSEMASYLMPSWFLGRNPKLKIIQATHNTELAVRFGRKVRDLIDDPHYQEIFPDTKLKDDNKGAGNWQTSAGGEYFAAGVGSAVTGRGADLFVIDDPHSEQDALSETAFDHAYEWYTSGPRQRLQPGGSIIVVMTRWGKRDLVGRLLAQQASDPLADQWEVVEFPAILPSDEVLWPEFWTKDAMLSIKASLPLPKWSAQWQQKPTSAEAAIVKREWWREWEKEELPPVKYIIQAYDTAFSKKETADYSAITTWGVFDEDESGREAIILLDARRGRWNFPELKEIAFSEHSYWEPDMVIVEAKASGRPLIDELQKRGVPAVGFSPGRKAGGGGVDKTTRMHLVSPLFESGVVWAPSNKRFAEEVIEEVASFPAGDHDDFCFVQDTMIAMSDGSLKAIQDVCVGDVIKTPAGAKPVLASGFTGVRPTYKLRAGPYRLEGTGNHPIATTAGWKRIDTMSISDTIKVAQTRGVTWRFREKMNLLSKLFTTTIRRIGDILSPNTHIYAGTSGEVEGVGTACIAQYGNTTTAQFQRVGMSTTSTGMSTTMTFQTLSAFRPKSTIWNIQKSEAPEVVKSDSSSTLKKLEKKRLSGIVLNRGASGIVRSAQSILLRVAQLIRAGGNGLRSEKPTQSQGLARNAARIFRHLRVGLLSAVRRVRVESLVESGEKKSVYNLTVADAHCFYANGVLVHNCDSMTLALMRFRQGGLISIEVDEEDDETDSMPRTREYY